MERRDVMGIVRRERIKGDTKPEGNVSVFYLFPHGSVYSRSQSKKHGPGITQVIEINLTTCFYIQVLTI